jgi:regulator of sigma E protease
MNQLIISLIAFIVALGILVSVHEFGHFWVARKLGVKVLKFAIGFGKPLWRYQPDPDDTEYVIAALPLGGYVKMLDEREGEVAPYERHRAFNTQSVWKRIAIVAAGPLFNVILAVVLYTGVFIIGIPGMKPVVGEVEADSYAAAAGFTAGEQITAVETDAVFTWQDARLALLDRLMETDSVRITVQTPEQTQAVRTLNFGGRQLLQESGDILDTIGLSVWQPVIEPVIGEVQPGSAAARAGLQPGDRIVMANDQPVAGWHDLVEVIRAHAGTELRLQVTRGDQSIAFIVVPDAKQENSKTIGFIGAGVRIPEGLGDEMRITVRYSLLQSVVESLYKTWDMTMLSFRMIGQLITGNASPRNISGPITIAEYAGKTAQADLSFFLDFLAIISIGLAVLNILPIPLLDGGHLLYYAIEILAGRPLSERAQLVGQNIGIILLGCLMSLAFYNDIVRLMR